MNTKRLVTLSMFLALFAPGCGAPADEETPLDACQPEPEAKDGSPSENSASDTYPSEDGASDAYLSEDSARDASPSEAGADAPPMDGCPPDTRAHDGGPEAHDGDTEDHDADALEEQEPRHCMITDDEIVYVEAEQFDGSWQIESSVGGHKGSGYAWSNAAGIASTSMDATVEIPASGSYSVWVRGYVGGRTDRDLGVQVGDVVLNPTHGEGEGNWVWRKAGEVELSQGPVLVTIRDADTGNELVDAIALSRTRGFDAEAEELCWDVLDRDDAPLRMHDEILGRSRTYADSIPTPTTMNEWKARAEEIRPRLVSALGLHHFPDGPPEAVQHLGSTQLDGYRIERISYEAIPGFVVPVNVYVPDGDGPFPVVISPIGHWLNGKANPTPAARSHALAKLGYLSVTYDLWGKGERLVEENHHREFSRLLLTGMSNAGIEVRETLAALEYVRTRSDADTSKVAITGASGGGLATLYASAVAGTFAASIPVAFPVQFEALLETVSQCGCSYVPNVASFTNEGELLALSGPNPTMVIAAEDDRWFSLEGAMLAAEQAQSVFDLTGDPLALVIVPGPHDYSQTAREAMYGWVEKYISEAGDGLPVSEPSFTPLEPDDPAYACFGGQGVPETSETARSIGYKAAKDAVAKLPLPDSFEPSRTRDDLLELLHPPKVQEPSIRFVGDVASAEMRVELYEITVQPGVTLPARLVRGGVKGISVVIADESRERLPGQSALRTAHNANITALHVGVRGQGEQLWREGEALKDNVLLGDSLLGQRAFDLEQSRKALGSLLETEDKLGLIALGKEGALAGITAQTLWGAFDAMALGPLTSSFMAAYEGSGFPTVGHVFNVLNVADIPQFVAIAAERPVLLEWKDTIYTPYHPQWVPWFDERIVAVDDVDVAGALEWLTSSSALLDYAALFPPE